MSFCSASPARDIWVKASTAFCLCLVFTACTATKKSAQAPDLALADSASVPAEESASPPALGKPYQVAGRWYEPKEDPTYDRHGIASWYGRRFDGRRTANGEIFDRAALSAAHPTLPLPSYVRVTNLANDRSVIVRVNDRGPFSRSRLIDVSERTADLLGFKSAGMASVRVQYVARATTDGADDEYLIASYRGPPAGEANSLVVLASSSAEERPTSRGHTERGPIKVAALVSGAPEAPKRDPNQVAFVAETAPPERLAAEAVGALSNSYPADARISMTFDLLTAQAD